MFSSGDIPMVDGAINLACGFAALDSITSPLPPMRLVTSAGTGCRPQRYVQHCRPHCSHCRATGTNGAIDTGTRTRSRPDARVLDGRCRMAPDRGFRRATCQHNAIRLGRLTCWAADGETRASSCRQPQLVSGCVMLYRGSTSISEDQKGGTS